MISSQLEYDDKLKDKICCPKCKSLKLEVIELFTGANTFTTNTKGEVISAAVNVYNAVNPYKILFVCLDCDHSFRKNKIQLYSDVFENKY